MPAYIDAFNTTVSENDGFALVTFYLDGPSGSTVSVNYSTSSGTAGSAAYTNAFGTVSFAPGETSKTVRIAITDNTVKSGDQLFYLALSSPVNGILGRTSIPIAIVDNDAARGTPAVSVGNIAVDESGQFARFVVTLDRPSASSTSVAYATSDITAAAGQDYSAVSGTLTFAAGEVAKTVIVPILNDGVAENGELFKLVLSSPSGATLGNAVGYAEIAANDAPTVAVPVINAGNVAVGESDNYAEVVLQLSAPSVSTVSVNYSTSSGTAGSAAYSNTFGTVSFAPGETSKTVRIAIVDNTAKSSDLLFYLALSSPTNATLGRTAIPISIIDNDANAGTPAVSVGNLVVDESGQFARFLVTLDRPSTGITTVAYTTADITAAAGRDYAAIDGTLSFAAGEVAKTIIVPILNDGVPENSELFKLVLSRPSGASLGNAIGYAEIAANDSAPVPLPVISASNLATGEADGYAEVILRLSAPSTSAVSLEYSTSSGTVGTSAYINTFGSVLFAPGETVKAVRIAIVDNTADTVNGQFLLALFSPVNATLSRESIPITIIENDAPLGSANYVRVVRPSLVSPDGSAVNLSASAVNDFVLGTPAIDKVSYVGNRSQFTLSQSIHGFTLQKSDGSIGVDTFSNVERLQFSDSSLALDLGVTESAGMTALLLGAVLPGRLVYDPSKQALVGAAIGLFDAGFSMRELAGALLRLPIWDVLTQTTSPTNRDIANYLLTNVLGKAPTVAALNEGTLALNTESFQGEWLAKIAASGENQFHVNLVGVAQSGLPFGG